jgi:hypothetical protein
VTAARHGATALQIARRGLTAARGTPHREETTSLRASAPRNAGGALQGTDFAAAPAQHDEPSIEPH